MEVRLVESKKGVKRDCMVKLVLTTDSVMFFSFSSVPSIDRTGTAVNPLARALYLTRGRPRGYVTLLVPWLDRKEEQAKVYGDTLFESMEEQDAWIRKYSEERVGCKEEAENLKILFYPALYHDMFGSIFATVDVCSIVPQEEADIAILEEPEHLTWFRCLPPKLEESDHSSPNVEEDKESREQALIGWVRYLCRLIVC